MSQLAARYYIDLGQHLAECDTNYLRLKKLLPGMQAGESREIAIALGGSRYLTVSLTVVDLAPYTTTVRLRQCSALWGAAAPEMTVRAYHDARMAEVIDFQQVKVRHARFDYPNPRMHMPDEKQQVNRLLGEWLSMCLVHGHHAETVFA